MKRFLPSFILLLCCIVTAMGQAPKGINYQGVARDNDGKAYASKTISVRISILKNAANGEVEYAETHKPQTNPFGLFTLVIGQGTKVTGDFATITWAVGTKWLQIEIDPAGGNTFVLAGSQQLMSVPYAFYAETSGSSSSLTAGTGIAISNNVISNTGDTDSNPTNELQNLGEVLTRGNNAGGQKITNLGAPTVNTDAATKSYVDTQISNDLDKDPTNELQNLGQVLTRGADAGGQKITNLGAPTLNTDAATKAYVDTQISNDLDKDPTNELQNLGQVLTRGADAGGQKITNLGAPTLATDASTKSYVDAQNALDLDQSNTNEIQDLTLNSTTNILRITNNTSATNIDLSPYKQSLTYTPSSNLLSISGVTPGVTISTTLSQAITYGGATGANGARLQNVGAPSAGTDATTKAYVDNAIATNYAFKVPYSFTNAGAAAVNQIVPFSADVYDDFNVVASNRFTATASGTYMFFVDGTLNNAGISMELRVNSTDIYPIRKQDVIIGASVFVNTTLSAMIKLNAGDFVEVYITSFVPGDNATGHLFGYKL